MLHLAHILWEIAPEHPFTVKPAVHRSFVNDVYWPTVADQEPRLSGVFCVCERQALADSPRSGTPHKRVFLFIGTEMLSGW